MNLPKRITRAVTPPAVYWLAHRLKHGPRSNDLIEPSDDNSDPIITVTVHGVRLRLNRSHKLPSYVTSYPYYDTALSQLVKYLRDATSKRLMFVDVGANVGDTAALASSSVSRGDVEFICVEACEEFLDLLRANTADLDVQIVQALVGATTATRNLKIKSTGTGSASVSDSGSETAVTSLDDIVGTRTVDIIKIDTDGFEDEVLAGATKTIADNMPALHVEYSPRHIRRNGRVDPSQVLNRLVSLGYEKALIYDNSGTVIGQHALNGEVISALSGYAESNPHFFLDILVMNSGMLFDSFCLREVQRTRTPL